MPLFKPKILNQGSVSIGINDADIVNFLNPSGSTYVSATEALAHSDLYSIIFQLSADLATSKLQTDNLINQGLLNNPTQTSNGFSFWQSMFAQLLLDGNAFAYRWRNSNGVDVRWEYLRPSQVSTFLLDDGSGLIYNVTFDEPFVGVKMNISQSDMIHFRLLSNDGGKTGVSPLTSLSNELKIQDSSNRLTIAALAKSIVNPGILTIKGAGLLDAKTKSSRSRQFMNQINNSKGGPIVLDDLEEYTALEISSDVSKLLAQTDWTTRQIAKVYGISESSLNGKGDQQSSVVMMAGEYVKSLSRFSNPAVAELSNKLSSPVTIDLRPALDPTGQQFASQVASLTSSKALAPEQATWLLKESGYLPMGLPDPPNPVVINEGGSEDVESN